MHDIHLHYIEKGSGKPLILLHGNGEDSRYFKHQIRFFSRSRRVLAVDTRGHGKTKKRDKAFARSGSLRRISAVFPERKRDP
ncbi:MAG: alpha/beta fold hydrolase [Sellimonas intestinalis]